MSRTLSGMAIAGSRRSASVSTRSSRVSMRAQLIATVNGHIPKLDKLTEWAIITAVPKAR
jgi:hypothetical protein